MATQRVGEITLPGLAGASASSVGTAEFHFFGAGLVGRPDHVGAFLVPLSGPA